MVACVRTLNSEFWILVASVYLIPCTYVGGAAAYCVTCVRYHKLVSLRTHGMVCEKAGAGLRSWHKAARVRLAASQMSPPHGALAAY